MATPTVTPARPVAAAPPRWMLPVLLSGQALATMDSSIVNVAMPSIRTGLPASGAQVQLVSAGYLVAFAALVITGARLGDRYGHARMFRTGLAAFTAASLAAGFAPDANTLVAARVGQGAAAAVMVPQVVSLIQLRFAGAARARAIGAYSVVLAVGVAAGQILGGLVVTMDLAGFGWRPTLLVNGPVGVVLLVAGRRLLGSDGTPAVRRLDLPGVALLSTAMVALVTPLVFGRERGWPLWLLAVLAGGVGLLALFAGYEWRLARGAGRGEPLLDLNALRPPGVGTGLLACLLVMGAYTALIFTLSLHLQGGLDFSPLRAGLTFVPFAAGFATVSLAWTRLPERVHRWLPVLGPVLFAGGVTAVVALAGPTGWPTGTAVGLLFVAGAGHAASFSPLFARIGALVGARYGSALSALGNTGALLAGAVSVAGLGSLYLASAERAPRLSYQGLADVTIAIDLVLAVTAAGAAWTVTRSDSTR